MTVMWAAVAAVLGSIGWVLWTYLLPVLWGGRPEASWWQAFVAAVLLMFVSTFFTRGSGSND